MPAITRGRLDNDWFQSTLEQRAAALNEAEDALTELEDVHARRDARSAARRAQPARTGGPAVPGTV